MTETIKKPSYMSDFEFEYFVNGNTTRDQGYTIEPKLDFGRYGYRVVTNHGDGTYTAENVRAGWVITKHGVLATPGATWAKTLDDAHRMVAALVICDTLGLRTDGPEYAVVFWNFLRLSNSKD